MGWLRTNNVGNKKCNKTTKLGDGQVYHMKHVAEKMQKIRILALLQVARTLNLNPLRTLEHYSLGKTTPFSHHVSFSSFSLDKMGTCQPRHLWTSPEDVDQQRRLCLITCYNDYHPVSSSSFLDWLRENLQDTDGFLPLNMGLSRFNFPIHQSNEFAVVSKLQDLKPRCFCRWDLP